MFDPGNFSAKRSSGSRALGKLYASRLLLARFEENAGKTNTSLVRLETHAVFGVERTAAAVRTAAS